jgi:Nup133 N terminal like
MDYSGENKILIVSTLGEIKIFKYAKNQRENKIDLEDTKFSIPTDQQVVNKIVQVSKNGRVFYGGTSGHINELKYE